MNIDLQPIKDFLGCETPRAWIEEALQQQDLLLMDHANCEKKAAATAMNLMYRHVEYPKLLKKMSQLAREELLHFEQVVDLMRERGISYQAIGPSRYAGSLRKAMRSHEPDRLVDTLIVGAFVEARSCERFAALAPHLDAQLQKFYLSLLRSEARHFEDYLELAREVAQQVAQQDVSERIAHFTELEAGLITTPDDMFRFHSGPPGGLSDS